MPFTIARNEGTRRASVFCATATVRRKPISLISTHKMCGASWRL